MLAEQVTYEPGETIPLHVLEAFLTSVRPAIVEYSASTAYEAVGILFVDMRDDATAHSGVYPLINQKRSAAEFAVSKTLVSEALDHLDTTSRMPVALYHSHPSRPADPSNVDVELMKAIGGIHVIHGVDGIVAWGHNGVEPVRLASVGLSDG